MLADRWQGRRLNSPNDIVCAADGSVWFTDPSFGIDSDWEGDRAPSENPHAVYRLAADGAPLQRVIEAMMASSHSGHSVTLDPAAN